MAKLNIEIHSEGGLVLFSEMEALIEKLHKEYAASTGDLASSAVEDLNAFSKVFSKRTKRMVKFLKESGMHLAPKPREKTDEVIPVS